jgi:gluconate kinase
MENITRDGRVKSYREFSKYETIVLLGLPGSGKSHLARDIQESRPEKDFFIIEDGEYHRCEGMFGKNNVIMTDGHLIDDYFFNAFIRDLSSKKVPFTCYYFEVDLDKCKKNIMSRTGHYLRTDLALADLKYYSVTYNQKVETIKSSPLLVEAVQVKVYSSDN